MSESGRLYESLLNECEACLGRARAGEVFSVSSLGTLTGQLVRLMASNEGEWMRLGGQSGRMFSIALHGVNVAILTARVGLELEFKKQRLVDLALAGLLNDIGMVSLTELIESPRVLGAGQMSKLRDHPWIGSRLLERCSDVPPAVREIVLQEHERVDGSGYPQRLSGNKVQEDAQLVGLLDLYEALSHERPHRRALVPADAMRTVVLDHRSAFRDDLLRTLLNTVPIFPPESWVQLKSGAVAQVVSVSRSNPLAPIVRVVSGMNAGGLKRGEVLDLSRDPEEAVTGALRQPLLSS